MVNSKKYISLVLSGGGARGIAHIGVIEELERQGFVIKSISGTSMGALVGGVYAAGKMQEFKQWICSLDKLEVFKLVDFTLSSQGLIKGDRLIKKIKEFVPDINIEELKINYVAIATDIINKNEVVFRTGSLYEAVRASISIPTVFTPVKIKNSLLVDGGVVNNIPINHVRRTKNDILVAVHVNADIPLSKLLISKKEEDKNQSVYLKKIRVFQNKLYSIHPKSTGKTLGYFNIVNESLTLLMFQLAKMMIKQYPPDILIEISRKSCGTFDFYKATDLVEIGRTAAIKSVKEYNDKLI